MKMLDFLNKNNFSDPDGVVAGYGFQKYDIKKIEKISERNGIIKFAFELDTNHPMYDGKLVLVIEDGEVYEVC